MSIQVALHHKTSYRYDRPVTLTPHVVRLRPAAHGRTPVVAYSMKVTPSDHFCAWQQDAFGNHQARLVFGAPTDALTVEVDLVVDLVAVNPFDFFLEEGAERHPVQYDPALAADLAPYLERAPPGPGLAALVEDVRRLHLRAGRRPVDGLVDVNRHLNERLRYDIRMEPGVFSPEETLTRGHGSCRDFAWLLVTLARHLGYAARFVSGYSIQLVADVPASDGPKGVARDVTDLHAWAEIYLPGAGWVGFDATSGLVAGEGHIPLACTPSPSSAAPITGAFEWTKRDEADRVEETMAFEMTVTRVAEQPRVTRPYRDDEWAAIDALGQQVDADLARLGVRLTMGGEPTFVSMDDADGAEWNVSALGPRKAALADALVRKLRARFASGGVLHHGQGKWYPGEPLPRWAYTCYFRADGQPLWRDPALIAGEAPAVEADASHAARFAELLARRLGIDAANAQPAFEDVLYYLWRERRLPANVDPRDARLDDPGERERLCRLFERGLGAIVGYALPLRSALLEETGQVRWESGPWRVRGDHLFLLPGDSPMGFRLPIESLPWEPADARQEALDRDPLAPRRPLPARIEAQSPRDERPATPTTPGPLVRTALCIEPRAGLLHVFLPPLDSVEAFVGLTAAIEDVARELARPVRLEGYHPPTDHRLCKLSVTPDPGVIEVNVHPATSWDEAKAITLGLYEDARACRLGAEAFMVDGRHTGTGGGNHIVLGGAAPADSPFLRRPDLLRSLAAYWINHPSLSYLFSGLFTGPTSQAPRVDEARLDAVHELDLAFAVIDQRLAPHGTREGAVPPWLVDRVFRNLLVDVTGNTHRAEICIDKLYSPDAASGRQGLVELRGFEMPPDPRMSLAQQLLVRALVATFWQRPYTQPAVRWGTGLVDRFSLPHFVAQDFADVLGDLARAGYAVSAAWFRAHHEFRFPLLGRVAPAGVVLELRQALEPWHVLGEEATATGTARYVDSSLERVEVKVRGLVEGRHLVTCLGRRVPLHPTGAPGEHVAGVRFRAWQPPSALHPTIGVHTPLVFDVLDTWAGRAIGGCQYHVSHPGGRAFDDAPANAAAAESRRAARFWAFGHSPGPREPPPPERNPDFPLTLDLRHPPRP